MRFRVLCFFSRRRQTFAFIFFQKMDAVLCAPKRLKPGVFGRRDDEKAAIDRVMKGDPSATICTIDNVKLTRRDFRTLKPRQWLNDEIVNAYASLIQVWPVMNARAPFVVKLLLLSAPPLSPLFAFCTATRSSP